MDVRIMMRLMAVSSEEALTAVGDLATIGSIRQLIPDRREQLKSGIHQAPHL